MHGARASFLCCLAIVVHLYGRSVRQRRLKTHFVQIERLVGDRLEGLQFVLRRFARSLLANG